MGTAHDLIGTWAADSEEKIGLNSRNPELVLRWLNEAQLRFADLSECLRGVWNPDIFDDGIVDLPEDFLREYVNRIRWTSYVILRKGDYATLRATPLTVTNWYAIYGGKFYVFAPSAGTPEIAYVRKPESISLTSLNTSDLEIPTEYQLDLLTFLDAMWEGRKGNAAQRLAFLEMFNQKANAAGIKFSGRDDAPPTMRGGLW